jgi:ATP-binding cassette subfamily B (MDR/TAP) protein 9
MIIYAGCIMDSIVSNAGPERFQHYTLLLILYAVLCGVFTGLRGGVFTVVGARVNRRIRLMLFSSLMRQEMGFYDTTRTGEISSRLNADSTKVGDQVSLNVSTGSGSSMCATGCSRRLCCAVLRNAVQAIGTLIFMFIQSWKLRWDHRCAWRTACSK